MCVARRAGIHEASAVTSPSITTATVSTRGSPGDISKSIDENTRRAAQNTSSPASAPAATFTRRRAGCVVEFPLETLTAGDYLVRFDASAEGRTSGRTLRLSVE